ncbi:MAG: hypothetical protein ABI600_06780 [Luteolibacter sp.]
MKTRSSTQTHHDNQNQGQLFEPNADFPDFDSVPIEHKLTPPHPKHTLRTGFHVAVVTSRYAGCGGSMLAWETYVACGLSGIPAILATFDHQHRYPDIGSDLRRLGEPGVTFPGENESALPDELIRIAEEAQAENKFLIIDVPAGFDADHPMFEAIQNAGIPRASSIAALMPVHPSEPGSWGAALSTTSFREIGIWFDQGLFRFWDSHRLTPLPNLSLPKFPMWKAAYLSRQVIQLIHQRNWHFDQQHVIAEPMKTMPQDFAQFLTESPAQYELSTHIEAARKAIFHSILSPISVSLP